MPSSARDHSAFRLDTEVFGWSADFKEVGAVVMEVARGPQGRHRGECYMLIYGVDEYIPRHNVITHTITHADLPHNPVPLNQAKDFLWSIEFSYQQMWPHRPQRTWRKGDMQVTPLWAAVPTGEDGICRPWVATKLHHQKQTKWMPYRPVDLTARCALLRMNDTRTYWGTSTLAASMVRFDFAPRPHNEESARFLFSSHWQKALTPHIELSVPTALVKGPRVARLFNLLTSLAPTTRKTRAESLGRARDIDDTWQADIEGGHDWLPLAIGAVTDLGIALGRVHASDGPLRPPPRAADPDHGKPAPAASAAPAASTVAPSRLQGALAAARRPRFGEDAVAGGVAEMPARLPSSLAGESGMVDDIVTQHDPIEDAFADEPSVQFHPKHEPTGDKPAARALPPALPPTGGKVLPPHVVRITLRRAGAPLPAEPTAPNPPDTNDRPPQQGRQDAPAASSTPASPGGRFLQDWSP